MLWTHNWFYFTVWHFFLYEKCLYRDASCAKRWHLILPVNWNLCLGPKYAGWDSLSNGMLLSFNQAITMVLFSWSWHMTLFLVWCRINRPWIHLEIPNGGWTEKCWMWWRGYGRVVVTMQAWSIEETWELEISLNNFCATVGYVNCMGNGIIWKLEHTVCNYFDGFYIHLFYLW